MKLFAFFLPQFHTIPENDEWWGEGFTEWTNVKAANPIYPGQKIRHPYKDNYYNLLDKEVVNWQTGLLDEYGLDGLIYYHYYFKGKLLLEKPAENLLKWKDIKQRFFFCWANHSWIKSWRGNQDILMPMEYGGKPDWETHFQYLLPFFKDERYEKKNNRPLFMLFNYDFDEKEEMLIFLDARCKQEGFDGICVIETFNGKDIEDYNNKKSSITQYTLYREPVCMCNVEFKKYRRLDRRIASKLRKLLITNGIFVYDGEKLIKKKTKLRIKGDHIINSIWFEWDNTSRHGKRGYIISPFSRKSFVKYMDTVKDEEYMFINAWNEWCEGMILEPTEEEGYKYLEWIRDWRLANENRIDGI